MANLIITVVAIALVAVASLMGAYYGGQAFTEGRDQANASTVLTQGQQIAAAFRMAEAQGGDLSAQDALWNATLNDPTYLNPPTAPENDSVTEVSTGQDWYFAADTDLSAAANPDAAGTNVVVLQYDDSVGDMCTEVNEATGATATAITGGGAVDVSGDVEQAGCASFDAASDGVDNHFFYFRL